MDLVDPKTSLPGVRTSSLRGTSSGLNIAPGSDDDGWVVPQRVTMGDGSTVQLFKDGELLRAAYEAIRNARRRVCLEMYTFASDATGRAFARALCDKARQGVQVYVIQDSFGSLASDRAMFDDMRRAGCNVQEFHPFWPWRGRFQWRPTCRDHRKLIIIDDDFATMGGLNLAGEYAGSWVVPSLVSEPCDFWRDTGIGMTGPVIKRFLRAFARTWHYATHHSKLRTLEYVDNLSGIFGESCPWPLMPRTAGAPRRIFDTPEGPGQMGVLASVPQRNSPLRPLLNRLIRDARKSLSLTMAYFAPHDDLIDELCRAARRGVRVRLMLPGKCDVALLMVAARSFYDTLMTAGVQIYERKGVVLHAKTIVADALVSVVGSTNLDYRSIEYNLELSALIRSRQFGRQMEDLFDHDVRFSQRIWPHHWRHRPVRDRITQWLVSRARYVL